MISPHIRRVLATVRVLGIEHARQTALYLIGVKGGGGRKVARKEGLVLTDWAGAREGLFLRYRG